MSARDVTRTHNIFGSVSAGALLLAVSLQAALSSEPTIGASP
jgi:hypothetical protein